MYTARSRHDATRRTSYVVRTSSCIEQLAVLQYAVLQLVLETRTRRQGKYSIRSCDIDAPPCVHQRQLIWGVGWRFGRMGRYVRVMNFRWFGDFELLALRAVASRHDERSLTTCATHNSLDHNRCSSAGPYICARLQFKDGH